MNRGHKPVDALQEEQLEPSMVGSDEDKYRQREGGDRNLSNGVNLKYT